MQISKHETSAHGVECQFKVISKGRDVYFHCFVCDQKYKAGPVNQNLQNLRIHIKNNIHNSNLSALKKTKGMEEECTQKASVAFKTLECEYPGHFLLKHSTAVCRDCPDVAITLVSNRGGKPTIRAKSHLASSSHKAKSKRGLVNQTKDLTSYFTAPTTSNQKNSSQ